MEFSKSILYCHAKRMAYELKECERINSNLIKAGLKVETPQKLMQILEQSYNKCRAEYIQKGGKRFLPSDIRECKASRRYARY